MRPTWKWIFRSTRRGLARLELVCDGPARALRRGAEALLLVGRIDLHDHAVDFERQAVPFLLPVVAEVDHLPERFAQGRLTAHGQSELAQAVQGVEMRGRAAASPSAADAEIIGGECQRTAGRPGPDPAA